MASTAMPRVRAQDVAGLKQVTWIPKSSDQTVAEMIDELVAELRLPEDDGFNSPIVYSGRRESDGMALSPSEKAVDVLSENDQVVLEPDVNAGAG
jgi:hypothetical protein